MSNQEKYSPRVPAVGEKFEAAAEGQATRPAPQEKPYQQQQHPMAGTWALTTLPKTFGQKITWFWD